MSAVREKWVKTTLRTRNVGDRASGDFSFFAKWFAQVDFFSYLCSGFERKADMQFKDIIGQEDVKQRLRQSVQEGRVAHAQLFCGPEGVGKLPLAIAYAQYLNCPHRTAEDSCGVCPT